MRWKFSSHLAYLFNSISRQHCEVWALQFSFLHSLREVIYPSESCLYGHINWSLTQTHSVGLSQSFPPKRGGQGQTTDWVPKGPVSGSVPGIVGHLCLRGLTLESGNEAHLSGKKSAGGSVSISFAESRRKGGVGVSAPDVPKPSTFPASSSSTSATFQIGTLFKFFDQ